MKKPINKIIEDREEKYLKMLQELKIILDNTSYINMTKFVNNYRVSTNVIKVLVDGGIAKCIKKGRYPEWEWTTIQPNIHMAKRLINESNNLKYKYETQNISSKETKKQKTLKKIEKPKQVKNLSKKELDYYELTTFFNLIKIKITPKYK